MNFENYTDLFENNMANKYLDKKSLNFLCTQCLRQVYFVIVRSTPAHLHFRMVCTVCALFNPRTKKFLWNNMQEKNLLPLQSGKEVESAVGRALIEPFFSMHTARKFKWWRCCLALCDEIFSNFLLFDETLSHIWPCENLTAGIFFSNHKFVITFFAF